MDISRDTALNGVDDSSFRICNGSELSHRGIVNGDVEVLDGSFVLHGILNGSLDVSEKGSAKIYGIANLSSASGAGSVDVFGIVKSDAIDESRLALHPGCIVNGVEY